MASLFDTLTGHTAAPEMELIQNRTDLGIDEYHKYRVALEKARYEIRGDYERSKTEEATLRTELMDKYQKLYNYEIEENERKKDEEKRKSDESASASFQLFGGQKLVANRTTEESEARQRQQYQSVLLKECEDLHDRLGLAESKVGAQTNSLANFLNDEARTVAAVEQAEALNTKLMRSQQRHHAYQSIITALRGSARVDAVSESLTDAISIFDDVDSTANRGLRATRDNEGPKFSADVDAVEEELNKLERLEEHTDQLVDRLKVKLDAINLLEESQVEMVEFQVRRHERTYQKIIDIENQVKHNNDDLNLLNEQMKAELVSRLKVPNTGWQYNLKVLVFVLAIGALVWGLVYYVGRNISEGFF